MGKDLKGKELGKGFSQRKDGRYEARTVINGVKIDIYDMKLSELKRRFELEKIKVLRDEKNERPNVKLKDWYLEWFTKCKAPGLKNDSSRRVYDRKVRNTYVKLLGGKKLEDISQINIQTASNTLVEQGYTPRTVKEALCVLRECFDIAVANKLVPVNPCVSITIREEAVMKERRVLTHEEQDLFLTEIEGSYYYEAYVILLSTGMRIGEFSGLQWQDVDFEKKQIYIRRSMTTAYYDGKKIEELTTPKTFNSYRTIPFFGDVEKYFKSWKKKQEIHKTKMGSRWRCKAEYGDLVFTSTVGSPVTRYVISHDIQKIENRINMKEAYRAATEGRDPIPFEHIYPHAFRHTFATRCFEKNLDPVFVQSIMGHSNYSTTLSYTHVLDNVVQDQRIKAGNFLSCVKESE